MKRYAGIRGPSPEEAAIIAAYGANSPQARAAAETRQLGPRNYLRLPEDPSKDALETAMQYLDDAIDSARRSGSPEEEDKEDEGRVPATPAADQTREHAAEKLAIDTDTTPELHATLDNNFSDEPAPSYPNSRCSAPPPPTENIGSSVRGSSVFSNSRSSTPSVSEVSAATTGHTPEASAPPPDLAYWCSSPPSRPD